MLLGWSHHNFPFLMLCDESKAMIKAYKAWGPKKFMGREYKGIYRITYVINKNGRRILLEVMQENLSAIRLYEKMGFKVVGDRKYYYTKGQHAICFNLELKNG